MAQRQLDLTLISANNLKDVHLFRKMAVYAIATLSNDPRSEQRTFVDKDGGKSPTWNFYMRFFIPAANPDGLDLHIQLKSKRTLANRDVGEVRIPIRELLLMTTSNFSSWRVINPSGEPEGILNISHRIGDEVAPPQPPQPPVTAYQRPAGAYPPPQWEYWYGAPQPQPQPGYGYGYPPPQPQPQPEGYGYEHPQEPEGYGYEHPQEPQEYGYSDLDDGDCGIDDGGDSYW